MRNNFRYETTAAAVLLKENNGCYFQSKKEYILENLSSTNCGDLKLTMEMGSTKSKIQISKSELKSWENRKIWNSKCLKRQQIPLLSKTLKGVLQVVNICPIQPNVANKSIY